MASLVPNLDGLNEELEKLIREGICDVQESNPKDTDCSYMDDLDDLCNSLIMGCEEIELYPTPPDSNVTCIPTHSPVPYPLSEISYSSVDDFKEENSKEKDSYSIFFTDLQLQKQSTPCLDIRVLKDELTQLLRRVAARITPTSPTVSPKQNSMAKVLPQIQSSTPSPLRRSLRTKKEKQNNENPYSKVRLPSLKSRSQSEWEIDKTIKYIISFGRRFSRIMELEYNSMKASPPLQVSYQSIRPSIDIEKKSLQQRILQKNISGDRAFTLACKDLAKKDAGRPRKQKLGAENLHSKPNKLRRLEPPPVVDDYFSTNLCEMGKNLKNKVENRVALNCKNVMEFQSESSESRSLDLKCFETIRKSFNFTEEIIMDLQSVSSRRSHSSVKDDDVLRMIAECRNPLADDVISEIRTYYKPKSTSGSEDEEDEEDSEIEDNTENISLDDEDLEVECNVEDISTDEDDESEVQYVVDVVDLSRDEENSEVEYDVEVVDLSRDEEDSEVEYDVEVVDLLSSDEEEDVRSEVHEEEDYMQSYLETIPTEEEMELEIYNEVHVVPDAAEFVEVPNIIGAEVDSESMLFFCEKIPVEDRNNIALNIWKTKKTSDVNEDFIYLYEELMKGVKINCDEDSDLVRNVMCTMMDMTPSEYDSTLEQYRIESYVAPELDVLPILEDTVGDLTLTQTESKENAVLPKCKSSKRYIPSLKHKSTAFLNNKCGQVFNKMVNERNQAMKQLRRSIEFETTKPVVPPTFSKYLENDLTIESQHDNDYEITKTPVFIFDISIYHPDEREVRAKLEGKHWANNNSWKQPTCKMEFLDTEMVSDLRMCLNCVKDCITTVDYESTENKPVLSLKDLNYHNNPDWFMIIEETVFYDGRFPGSLEQANKLIHYELSSSFLDSAFYTLKDASKTKLGDLELRFGFPYRFFHQNGCMHSFIFHKIKMADSADLIQGVFPRYHPLSSFPLNIKCQAEGNELAQWVVTNSPALEDGDYEFLCTGCAELALDLGKQTDDKVKRWNCKFRIEYNNEGAGQIMDKNLGWKSVNRPLHSSIPLTLGSMSKMLENPNQRIPLTPKRRIYVEYPEETLKCKLFGFIQPSQLMADIIKNNSKLKL